MEAEENLLKALQYLDSLMVPGTPNAGSGVAMGLGEFLRKYNCKMTTYLGTVLKDEGFVAQIFEGKKSIIFWNKKEKPNMKMAEEIVALVRERKTVSRHPATERQRLEVIRQLLEEAEKEKLDLEAKIRDKEVLIDFLKSRLDG